MAALTSRATCQAVNTAPPLGNGPSRSHGSPTDTHLNVGHANKASNYAFNYHPTRRGGGRNAAAPQVPIDLIPLCPGPHGPDCRAHLPVHVAYHPQPSLPLIASSCFYRSKLPIPASLVADPITQRATKAIMLTGGQPGCLSVQHGDSHFRASRPGSA